MASSAAAVAAVAATETETCNISLGQTSKLRPFPSMCGLVWSLDIQSHVVIRTLQINYLAIPNSGHSELDKQLERDRNVADRLLNGVIRY